MTWVLVRKLLRDNRNALIVIGLLLGAFQFLWATVTGRILGQLAPFFHTLGGLGGLSPTDIEQVIFDGPGKIVRTLIGGDMIDLNNAMGMLSIGFVHPLVQTILCIWAVGRASGAIAGEVDRGTMELLMAQPMSRSRLILAHFLVDCITIPILCLCLWIGAALGAYSISPIEPEKPTLKKKSTVSLVISLGPLKMKMSAIPEDAIPQQGGSPTRMDDRLDIRAHDYWPGLLSVGGLIFSVSGLTMLLSSLGRSRWHILGLAVFLTLIQFLVNLIGQMWFVMKPFRPWTVFYYYQPQKLILDKGWSVDWYGIAQVPTVPVLFGVGLVGYLLAWRIFTRRDLPAPL